MLRIFIMSAPALVAVISLGCVAELRSPEVSDMVAANSTQKQTDQGESSSGAARAITIAIAGDVMLGRLVNETIAQRGFDYPWGNVSPVLNKADLFLINLEFTLTTETRPMETGPNKPFNFRADPSVVKTLEAGGVDFANVANNHILDFGNTGLQDTLEILDRASIAHAGAGMDLASARKPVILTADGVRIGIVSFADYPQDWAATRTTPGINYTRVSVDSPHFETIERAISEVRQQADLVIFTIHWGPNMRARPTEAFQEFARKVAAAGADIFWGHSAHVVQGVEVYDGKLILYDTGDFVDDYYVEEDLRNDLTALFLVKVAPPSIESLEIVPVQIGDMQVNLAEGQERKWIVQRLASLSEELGTSVPTPPHESSLPIAFR